MTGLMGQGFMARHQTSIGDDFSAITCQARLMPPRQIAASGFRRSTAGHAHKYQVLRGLAAFILDGLIDMATLASRFDFDSSSLKDARSSPIRR